MLACLSPINTSFVSFIAVAHGLDSAHLSRQFAETLLAAARQTADEALRAAGFDVVLHEREDMNARFLMPDDGYASE